MKVEIGKYPNNKRGKKFKKRKIKIKIDGYDTWNADQTMALIIVPLLKKFKKTSHGYPSDLAGPNVTDQLSYDGEDIDGPPDEGFKEWKIILGKMIWSFEQVLDFKWEQKYSTGKTDYKFKKIKGKKGKTVGHKMVHGKKHTLVIDMVGMKKHRERMQEGFDLFGKYFQSLWN